MRSASLCFCGISAVLLITLIGSVLLDVAVAALLLEVFRHLLVRRGVLRSLRRRTRALLAAVCRRNGRHLARHRDLLDAVCRQPASTRRGSALRRTRFDAKFAGNARSRRHGLKMLTHSWRAFESSGVVIPFQSTLISLRLSIEGA